jgi:hypothetical protein
MPEHKRYRYSVAGQFEFLRDLSGLSFADFAVKIYRLRQKAFNREVRKGKAPSGATKIKLSHSPLFQLETHIHQAAVALDLQHYGVSGLQAADRGAQRVHCVDGSRIQLVNDVASL